MKKTTKAKKSTSRTAKKATAAQKQNKLDSLNLSDGKLEVEKVRELEQLLGVDQVNAFKTNNLDVFQDNLSEMSLTDSETSFLDWLLFSSLSLILESFIDSSASAAIFTA